MTVSLHHLVVDAHDLPAQARFRCQVLDWRVLFEAEDEIVIGADAYALPGLCFAPVPEPKTYDPDTRSSTSARPSLRMRWSM